MQRNNELGCLAGFGLLLSMFAFVVLAALIVLPAIGPFQNNPLLMRFQATINCPPGNTFAHEGEPHDPQPGAANQGARSYCVAPSGVRTVLTQPQTLRGIAISGVLFVILLLIGSALWIGPLVVGGLWNETNDAPPVYQPPVYQPPVYHTHVVYQPPVYQPPVYQPPVYQPPPAYYPPANRTPVNPSMAVRLQQLEEARANGLIALVEYERLRASILNEA